MDSIPQRANWQNCYERKSQVKAILLLEGYVLILFLLIVGNCLTLLVKLLNRRRRKVPHMLVASLAVSDLLIGPFSSVPFSVSALVTSHWTFNNYTASKCDGYMIEMLACRASNSHARWS